MNLGPGVNTAFNESGPSVFEDEETGTITLYFSSDQRFLDSEDIFASTLQEDGTFGPAVLVDELSSSSRDVRPSITKDGLTMYFDSNRPGSLVGSSSTVAADLWWAGALGEGGFWRPLPSLVIQGSLALFGERAFPLHLLSIPLHGASAVLIAALTWRLAGPLRLGLLAGVAFLACEDHSMVVGWTTTITDVLGTTLVAAALLAHALWLERRRPATLVVSLLALILALGSKESAVVAPLGLVGLSAVAHARAARARGAPGGWLAALWRDQPAWLPALAILPLLPGSVLLALLASQVGVLARRGFAPAAPVGAVTAASRLGGWWIVAGVLVPGLLLSIAFAFVYRASFELPARQVRSLVALVEAHHPARVIVLNTSGPFLTCILSYFIEPLTRSGPTNRPVNVPDPSPKYTKKSTRPSASTVSDALP